MKTNFIFALVGGTGLSKHQFLDCLGWVRHGPAWRQRFVSGLEAGKPKNRRSCVVKTFEVLHIAAQKHPWNLLGKRPGKMRQALGFVGVKMGSLRGF